MSPQNFIFPKGFFWGAATSAHQVEGGNINDWSEWERRNAKIKSQNAKLYPPAGGWPDYILKNYPNPLQEENYISGRACDHYNRFQEDFDIAKSLGHNAHRFSIEWSRIEPEEGKFNEKEIEHYRKVIRALKERGMEPFVTLWHWAIPVWFSEEGGWSSKRSVEYFSRYAGRMVIEFSNVKFWVTLSEANVYSAHGYWQGDWPPEKHSTINYLKVNRNLARAHCKVFTIIKKVIPDAHVGVTQLFIYFSRSRIKSFAWNHLFLKYINSSLDFIGVDYYFSDRKTSKVSEFLQWSIDPEGLHHVLRAAARYKKPIYVIENGIADAQDRSRSEYIRNHIDAVRLSIVTGVDVRGYFYWSLLDNFEWDKGFWPRFGLVEVDYRTMERKIRTSAYEYKKIIEEGFEL